MQDLKGKKLLILAGRPVGTEDIIKYAKSKGVYTIVVDYLPKEKSIGKRMADECWDISTAEVDEIVKRAKEAHVDGVYTGVHEFNVVKTMEVCERLGLPFYATKEQWEVGTDKALFKKICNQYDLPTAKTYSYDNLAAIKYPVIVKPVDGSSGKGISICQNEEELKVAYQLALDESIKKEVIVEQYLYGDEFVVFYTIVDGVSKLSVMTDYYYNYDQKVTMPLPQVYIYPSRFLDDYFAELDEKVRKMLKGLNIMNGTFFLQGFVNETGFYFFEPGYRPGGSSTCRYTKYLNGISYMEMLVNYSLTGSMGDDVNKENAYFAKKCCTLSLVVKGGKIGKIQGYDEIASMPYVISSEKRFDVGDVVKEKSALGQIVLRFFIVDDSIELILRHINEIQDTVRVIDEDGENMLIAPFDTNRLNGIY